MIKVSIDLKMYRPQNNLCNVFKYFMIMLPVVAPQASLPLALEHAREARQGLATPTHLDVAVGHDALLRLHKPLVNQVSCTITTPWGANFTTAALPAERYESWGGGCGIHVRSIQLSDAGRWRLTASRSDHIITGFSAVHVLNMSTTTETTITLSDATTNHIVNLTDLPNAYCTVARPFTPSELVAGHCEVQVERVSRALQGAWSVYLGLPGRIAEVAIMPQVTVEAERLDSGFIEDSSANKLHLYCNLLHTDKTVTFCRFQRSSDSQGYSVRDGLSDGHYSYYGEGFEQKQCGLTIEQPAAQDYGTWRCAVGVSQLSGVTLTRSALQGLISVSRSTYSAITSPREHSRPKNTDSAGVRHILAVNNTQLTVSCKLEYALSYCWFRVEAADGARDFTPAVRQEVEYTGEGLDAGDCGITFAHALPSLSGVWTCHMAPRNAPGLELTDQLNVRVTGYLAATQQVVIGDIGGTATLECRTADGIKPLGYCRFLSPNSLGLRLDASVTATNAILGRYHLTPGTELVRGACALTIAGVTADDVGAWTCAAVVDGDAHESADTLVLVASDGRILSTASIAGMAVGALVVSLALVILLVSSVGKKMGKRPDVTSIPMQEMVRPSVEREPSEASGSVGRVSAESGASGEYIHAERSSANL